MLTITMSAHVWLLGRLAANDKLTNVDMALFAMLILSVVSHLWIKYNNRLFESRKDN